MANRHTEEPRAAQAAWQCFVEKARDDRVRHDFQFADGSRGNEPDLSFAVWRGNTFGYQIDVPAFGPDAAEYILVRLTVALVAGGIGAKPEPRIDIAAPVQHALKLARAPHAQIGFVLRQIEILRRQLIILRGGGIEKSLAPCRTAYPARADRA